MGPFSLKEILSKTSGISAKTFDDFIEMSEWDDPVFRIMQFYALVFNMPVDILAPYEVFENFMKKHFAEKKSKVSSFLSFLCVLFGISQ